MIQLYPVCWRNRDDCEPIDCIDAMPIETSEEDMMNFNYTPESFVCAGKCSDPRYQQDQYRLCFKNAETDEISDNDTRDLSSILSVVSKVLFYDANMKANQGFVEIPHAAAGGENV